MKVVIRPGSGLFKTAKTLGPTVPMPLLAATDKAIEQHNDAVPAREPTRAPRPLTGTNVRWACVPYAELELARACFAF